MRGYSPQNYSPPRRGYGNHGRSPPRRGHGGGGGRRREQNHGSLLVRNIPLDCRPEELRGPFEKYGKVRDVYIPRDYYTGEPRGFAFVEFVDAYDASEARYHMNGKIFAGREISVVVAAESRKRPEDMRHRTKQRGPSGNGGRRFSSYGRSSRSISRSRSPPHVSGSRSRYRSRSYSPAQRHRSDGSVSPRSRPGDHPKSPRYSRKERDDDHNHRSYSPGRGIGADHNKSSGYTERLSPGRVSRSPSGSRSRSADPSPERGR